jgi:triacylglycerol esterase/lipase EstA (alpha/beta hydrolase family)
MTGKNEVDIIAHSMGGLVTRAYIQSNKYNNDIRSFEMIGTPNKGASRVYYLYNGDPVLADVVAGRFGE